MLRRVLRVLPGVLLRRKAAAAGAAKLCTHQRVICGPREGRTRAQQRVTVLTRAIYRLGWLDFGGNSDSWGVRE